MPKVDDLIGLIDARDEEGALALLEGAPELVTLESKREGGLEHATPLHCTGQLIVIW
jgi:hypothetical protein